MANQLNKLFCCIKVYLPCLFDDVKNQGVGSPLVGFSERKGPRVRISNFYVTGIGTVLANVPLIQSKAFWEFKVVEKGDFCVGVCEPSKQSLDKQLTERKRCWAFVSKSSETEIKKGDTIGLAYDLSDIRPVLKIYLNGKLIKNIKCAKNAQDVYPCVSVDEGCMLEANFEGSLQNFQYGPPNTYLGIMYTRDIL
uniref:SPRY domain-containing protein n=1 Tax=Amorphochlora amoebiformis TaxID=1561963 RepID=A0A7S0H5V5_9EUKA|mmetsp:Transcript_48/g.56  ORF Transcript_48/g.56 Transcript_48/m.56 type:complete len:195 (+) Transcript_48:55-639(+)